MKKTEKNAFTLYELVIVIVVIAILAAILIPTFAGLIEKSRIASDSNMIASVNLALADDEESYGKPDTMYDALLIALDVGYNLESYDPVSKGKIVYDSENNRFALINEKETKILFGEDETKKLFKAIQDSQKGAENKKSGDYRLWRISKKDAKEGETIDDLLTKGYSIYLASDADLAQIDALELKEVGFDAGNNTGAVKINYTCSDDRTVVIRTNNYNKDASVLTVNAPLGTVKHYGIIGTLKIEAVANESYHEFGYVGGFQTMTSGHFIVENGAKFHQTRADVIAVVGSNKYTESSGVIYGAHYYDADGKCVYGDDGGKEPEQTHTHNFVVIDGGVEATCTTAGYHILKCECGMEKVGEMISALGHDWIEQSRVEATKDDEGKITYKCSRCEATQEVSISKLNHVHQLTHYDAKQATCIEAGNVEYWECSECGGMYSDANAQNRLVDPAIPVDANAHSWGEIKYIWSSDYSTCTAVRVCQHSTDHKEFEISQASESVKQAASCTSDEISEFTATFTNTAFATQTVSDIKTADKTGHTVVTWIKVNDSTHSGTCSSCNENITEEHIFIGNSNKCSKCDYTRSTGTTPSEEKDGLRSDGFYYVNGEKYTGTTNGYEYIDGRLVVSANSYTSSFKMSDVYNGLSVPINGSLAYVLPTDTGYVTKEIVLDVSSDCTSDSYSSFDGQNEVVFAYFSQYVKYGITLPDDYSLKSIAVSYVIYDYDNNETYTFDLDGVIEYLYEAIYGDAIKEDDIGEGKTKKEVILQTLKDKYHFTENYYPQYTQSDDYQAYISDSNNSGVSFGKYLRNKYNIEGILQLGWTEKVNKFEYMYDGSTFVQVAWPSTNKTAIGVLNGNALSSCCEPEIILLFLKHTYENAFFTGISAEESKVSTLNNAISNLSSDFYKFEDENWMSEASSKYDVALYNIYDLQEGVDMSKIAGANKFYIFTASHGYLLTNMYNGVELARPQYQIIAENPNWSLN